MLEERELKHGKSVIAILKRLLIIDNVRRVKNKLPR